MMVVCATGGQTRMNGFDLLLLGILTLTGGAALIAQGRQQAVRHPHNSAGARWLTIGAVAFFLAVTRGRDTLFLVEHWENVLMPLAVLTVAWVITNARADRAGRKAAPAIGDERQP
jgi:hypothetical protein